VLDGLGPARTVGDADGAPAARTPRTSEAGLGSDPVDVSAADAHSDTRRRTLLAIAGFAVVAVVMTFPRLDRLGTHVVGDNGDAMLSLWTLDWVWDSWHHGWGTLWRGQFFQPSDRTLAYSEAELPVAFAYGIVRLLVRSDAAAFTTLSLAAWTASQYWCWRLLRRFTTSDAAAALGAVAWTFSAVRLGHQGFFQLGAGCFIPLVVLCSLRFLDVPSIRRGLELGAVLALLVLSASYYGLMMLVVTAVVLGGALVLRRAWPTRDHVVGLVAGAALAAVLVAPVAYQYVSLQRDAHFRRGPEAQFATSREDVLAVAAGNRWLADVPPFDSHLPVNVERSAFPGIVTGVLAVVGAVTLASAGRRTRPGPGARAGARHDLALVVVAGVLLLLLSAGDEIALAGRHVTMPYRVLRAAARPFAGIRATARFVVVWQLALAALAAVGASALLRRLGRRARVVLCMALGAVVLVESAVVVPLVRLPDDAAWTAVNEALADRPDGLVLELPIRPPTDLAIRSVVEAPRAYLSRIDDHPRVNGYSGIDPVWYASATAVLNDFPASDALVTVDDLGVRYVVIRTDTAGWYDPAIETVLDGSGYGRWDEALAAERLASIPPERLASVERFGAAWLVELTPSNPAAA
jgi:hypothetical protein